MNKYYCLQCGHTITHEVPFGLNPPDYGDKVICENCNGTQPKNWMGPA